MKKKIFIYMQEHMDPLWRRCFDRDILYQGQLFVPYSDLEKFYIQDNIKLCQKYPFYKFEIECVLVLKKFLEKNPQYENVISQLIENGQIHFSFAGNNIIDSNMVQGESIVRNLLNGYHYLKNKYNYCSEGVDRMDAFGNSAQLPQIIRGFGSKWVKHISYFPCDAPYWKGIDGSKVYNLKPPRIGSQGSFFKYRPCPVCHGLRDTHCEYCNDRRIDIPYMEAQRPTLQLNTTTLDALQIPGLINVGGEEILPTEDIIKWVQENKDNYDISFVTYQDYLPYYRNEIDRMDASTDIHSSPELNPTCSGTFVSRIKTKQYVRRLENKLAAAETIAALKMLQDGHYPKEQLDHIWEMAFFTMFHDSITGTHVDPAYEELMDIHGEADCLIEKLNRNYLNLPVIIEGTLVTVMNPNGINLSTTALIQVRSDFELQLTDESGGKTSIINQCLNNGIVEILFTVNNIPAFSTRTYTIAPRNTPVSKISVNLNTQKEQHVVTVLQDQVMNSGSAQSNEKFVIENEFYVIKAVSNGISEIFDKKINHTIAKESEYMVGEWLLEHDEGSPWATLTTDMRRIRLSPDTQLIRYEKSDDVQKLTFRIAPANIRAAYALMGFEIIYSISLVRNSDMIFFVSDVHWDTFNHRLRIAFPSAVNGKHFYEVPYAFLERKPYEPQIMLPNGDAEWNGAAGDYPAINWAGIQNERFSLALFNKGTPSYQINTDQNSTENIYLTVLRSPSLPTFLHEPTSYSMQEYDGMRDAGIHHFEYALKSYSTGFSQNQVVADGIGYNIHLSALPENLDVSLLPAFISNDVRISAVKCSEDNGGLIYRLAEYHGKNGFITFSLPKWVKAVYETDLKEDIIREIDIKNQSISVELQAFEIRTLYFKFL